LPTPPSLMAEASVTKLGDLELNDVSAILRMAAKAKPYNKDYIILLDLADAIDKFESDRFNGRKYE